MKRRLSVLRPWLDAFFPPRCVACDAWGQAPFCFVCSEANLDGDYSALIGFGPVRSLWMYGGPVQQAVHRMKYGRQLQVAQALASQVPKLVPDIAGFDLVIPVPLTRCGLKKRGFNPAVEIGRRTGIQVEWNCLRRYPVLQTQVGLGPAARRQNVQNTFVVKNPQRISGKRLLVVDDVMTTGSTLLESGQVLRAAGAKSIEGLVLARTLTEDPNIKVLDQQHRILAA